MVYLTIYHWLGGGHSQHDAVPDPTTKRPTSNRSCLPFPPPQWWISIKKWYQVLREIWSMVIALPGDIGLFSHMQEALCHVNGKRVTMTQGVHAFLS